MLSVTESTSGPVLDDGALAVVDAYFRAANYLSVGQIYLLDNPLLKKPLAPEHIKPRLLGHWGTTPGLNMIYAHCNRVIRERDLDMIYIIGPGHGGPAIASNSWLEGSYSDAYPTVRRDEKGLRPAVPPVLLPRRDPQPCRAGAPGLDPRGRRARLLAGARLRRGLRQPGPRGRVRRRRRRGGDRAAGDVLAVNKFLDPARDGAVLPILHLNGYKIANPTVLSRIGDDELSSCCEGCGWKPYLVEGDDPMLVHQAIAATLDTVLDEIAASRARARPTASPLAGDRRAGR